MKIMPTAMLVVVASMGLHAQAVSTAPTQAHQQQVIEVNQRIAGYKTDLSKLQSELSIAAQKAAETARVAKTSAAANREAADKLAANPRDKSLSDNANKLARKARQDARAARKSAGQQADLEKEVAKVQKKLDEANTELVSPALLAAAPAAAVTPPVPAATAPQVVPVLTYPASTTRCGGYAKAGRSRSPHCGQGYRADL